MAIFETHSGVLACALFLVNFVIGFVLAKYLSLGSSNRRRRYGAFSTCLLVVLQAFFYTISAQHFLFGILFTYIGFRLIVPGLTGGLASGKTTVSSYLKTRGYDVIDADEIAKSVLKRGTIAYRHVVKAFGESIIDAESGEIDRARMRQVVFEDASKRMLLNRLTHPWIFAKLLFQLFKFRIFLWRRRVILDIPLLFESRLHLFCGPVIVVYVSEGVQLRRLFERDRRCSEETLRSMVASQLPLEEKISKADIVFFNDTTKPILYNQVNLLLRC